MNKIELINFIKKQTNIKLENNKTNILNNKRKILYTKINKINKYDILNILNKYNIKYEEHIHDYYFIYNF